MGEDVASAAHVSGRVGEHTEEVSQGSLGLPWLAAGWLRIYWGCGITIT